MIESGETSVIPTTVLDQRRDALVIGLELVEHAGCPCGTVADERPQPSVFAVVVLVQEAHHPLDVTTDRLTLAVERSGLRRQPSAPPARSRVAARRDADRDDGHRLVLLA